MVKLHCARNTMRAKWNVLSAKSTNMELNARARTTARRSSGISNVVPVGITGVVLISPSEIQAIIMIRRIRRSCDSSSVAKSSG